jgi:UDP-2-acetamido-2-deoxy-ribo-hexuluronate aminotransferase
VFHQYTLILDVEGNAAEKRNALKEYLQQQGIPSMIYYPVSSHKQKMFEAFGGAAFNLPLTDWLNDRVISLPMHTEMDADQATFITTHVLDFVNNL